MSVLHGHTRLDLMRKGQVVKRIEKDNVITGWIGNCLSRGNFLNGISASKIMPIQQWFNGCLLTSKANDETKMYIAGDNSITACAGDGGYSGTYLPRGAFNTVESERITNGYKFVWDWTTSQGNGAIASICLTRPNIAISEFRTNAQLVDNAPAIEQLSLTATQMDEFFYWTIVDYEREVAYAVNYTAGSQQTPGVITVYESKINTKQLHLFGSNTGYITRTEHAINQTVKNYAAQTKTLSYDQESGTLHLITIVNNGTTLNDYAINTTNWTCTETNHTYSGTSFSQMLGWTDMTHPWLANGIMIRNGYFYAMSDGWTKIAKCNMTNDADVELFNNPVYTIYGGTPTYHCNGSFIPLPNGSWYKVPLIWNTPDTYRTTAIYCPNGDMSKLSICKWADKDSSNDGNALFSTMPNNYGTITSLSRSTYMNVNVCHGYVSTINNLSETVTKDASLTMKLTYSITETVS